MDWMGYGWWGQEEKWRRQVTHRVWGRLICAVVSANAAGMGCSCLVLGVIYANRAGRGYTALPGLWVA